MKYVSYVTEFLESGEGIKRIEFNKKIKPVSASKAIKAYAERNKLPVKPAIRNGELYLIRTDME